MKSRLQEPLLTVLSPCTFRGGGGKTGRHAGGVVSFVDEAKVLTVGVKFTGGIAGGLGGGQTGYGGQGKGADGVSVDLGQDAARQSGTVCAGQTVGLRRCSIKACVT
eukprot:354894-Chlamydomonas_euryale.AAC.5